MQARRAVSDVTVQLILRIAGIAFLVVSGLFFILAVHYYLSQNIRAVMDDLSGKTRAQGVAGARRRAGAERGKGVSRRPSRAASMVPEQGEAELPADESVPGTADALPAMPPFDEEDDMGTVLVAVASVPAGFAAPQGEDGMATMLETDAAFATSAASASAAHDNEALGIDGPGAASFRITRRIVMIHATEIIAANEEL